MLGVGVQLRRIPHLRLLHLTDGAPRDLRDAQRLGFATRADYAAARARELGAALRVLGLAGVPQRLLGEVDQEAAFALARLARAMVTEFDGTDAVLTHPYEGGHPDHDACAFIAQAACELLEAAGRPAPRRLEFPSYHERGGVPAYGVFWSDAACPERRLPLLPEELAIKRAALAEYRTQAQVLARFPIHLERLRSAPRYDFGRPPPPGSVLYERFGFALDGAAWRELARAAARELHLALASAA